MQPFRVASYVEPGGRLKQVVCWLNRKWHSLNATSQSPSLTIRPKPMGFCPLRPRLARPLFTISFSHGRNAASQIWPRKRRCLKMKEESFLLPKRVVFYQREAADQWLMHSIRRRWRGKCNFPNFIKMHHTEPFRSQESMFAWAIEVL